MFYGTEHSQNIPKGHRKLRGIQLEWQRLGSAAECYVRRIIVGSQWQQSRMLPKHSIAHHISPEVICMPLKPCFLFILICSQMPFKRG